MHIIIIILDADLTAAGDITSYASNRSSSRFAALSAMLNSIMAS